MLPQAKPKTRRATHRLEACIAMLMDELRLAQTWARPSLLFAIQRSPAAIPQAMQAMKQHLHELSLQTVQVNPAHEQADLLQDILRTPNPTECVFFIRNLGTQTQLYDGLNLHREWIVEHRLKVILWLTLDEMTLLSRRAPDFWAFRHRVIEFPAMRQPASSRVLPSGVLAWGTDDVYVMSTTELQEGIIRQAAALQTLPPANENLSMRAGLVLTLSRLYWQLGAHQQVYDLVQAELDTLVDTPLSNIQAWLHNALAINTYDQLDHKTALTYIEQALAADPHQGMLWSNHGVICRAAGQGGRSVHSLKRAIRLEPTSPLGWEALGYVHVATGKFTSATQAFEKALTLNPGRTQNLLMLAWCERQLGNVETARTLLARIDDADEYLALCRGAVLGDGVTGPDRVEQWLESNHLPRTFMQHDPALHYIFSPRL